jgi:hypothetical protein
MRSLFSRPLSQRNRPLSHSVTVGRGLGFGHPSPRCRWSGLAEAVSAGHQGSRGLRARSGATRSGGEDPLRGSSHRASRRLWGRRIPRRGGPWLAPDRFGHPRGPCPCSRLLPPPRGRVAGVERDHDRFWPRRRRLGVTAQDRHRPLEFGPILGWHPDEVMLPALRLQHLAGEKAVSTGRDLRAPLQPGRQRGRRDPGDLRRLTTASSGLEHGEDPLFPRCGEQARTAHDRPPFLALRRSGI